MSKVQKHSPWTSYHVSSASHCGALDEASRLPGPYSDYAAQRLAITAIRARDTNPFLRAPPLTTRTYCSIPQRWYTKRLLRCLGGLGGRPHTHGFAR